MATETTIAQLNGWYKEVYAAQAEDLSPLTPKDLYFYNQVPFKETERIGNHYNVPVILTQEHGISFGDVEDGAYGLAPAIPMTSKNAQVQSQQITMRTKVPVDTLSRSTGGAKVAFAKATAPIMESLLGSHGMNLELGFLYGRSATGLGQIESVTNVDTTHETLTISAATWAVGIWGGTEGRKLVIYKNTDASLISSAADAVFQVTACDPDLRTITVLGTTTGITALHAASGTAMNIFRYGATGLTTTDNGLGIDATLVIASMKESYGIDAIILNAGTLFGINAASYSLWKASSLNLSNSQLTFGQIGKAVNKAVGKGGLREEVDVLVCPNAWQNMNADAAAARAFDSSYSSGKTENGFESISFHGQSGRLNVISYPLIKEGEALVIPKKRLRRVGSTDVTFNIPGRKDEFFLHMPNNNGFEMRSYSDQAIFTPMPAKFVKIYGIVNA